LEVLRPLENLVYSLFLAQLFLSKLCGGSWG
jgi:hypothetical protein